MIIDIELRIDFSSRQFILLDDGWTLKKDDDISVNLEHIIVYKDLN